VLSFGPTDNKHILTRFTTTGARDMTFGGGDAWVDLRVQSFPVGVDWTFTPDGKFLVAAESEVDHYRLSLRRFQSDGTLDTTFGEGGVAEYVRPTLAPQRVLFDQSGNVLVAGFNRSHDSALARLVPVSDNVFLNAEGVLSIDGTGGHDTVSLERSGEQLIVHRNGGTRTFPGVGLKKLLFWGYTGNDSVTVPFALDAELQGFAGNDTFTLGDGNITIDAGNGAATIVAGNGTHKIVVGNGHNSMRLGSGSASIGAGSGNDTITTGDGSDSIVSGDGDDSIITGGGNDTIYTGHGNDEVAAGAGNDVIQAFKSQTPFDSLEGPVLELPRDGGNGRKLYFGEDGDDYLVAGAAGTRLFGGEGDDEIYGNVTNDSISAGGGNDTVQGAPGSDTINGGPGDDRILGDREFDSFSDGGDLLIGGDGNDSLYGQAGDDTLLGGAGANVLDHGLGNVSLANGVLTFDGTDSNDEVSISRNAGDGDIDVWIEGWKERFPAADVSRIALFGRGGNDVLKLHPSLRIAATLDGGAGDDVLLGGAASDELRGSDGGDYLSGFAGDDYLNGGRGDDALRGGDGKDELDYSSRTANLVVTLDDVQNDGEIGEGDYAAPDVERVRGGSGNDDITGSPWLNLLYGNEGDDTLRGGAGADGLYGAAGNDRFDGGPGDDYIEGGAGNDELHGSGGVDQLFGLGGNDRIFAAGDGAADLVRGGPGEDGADTDELDDVLAVETAL
jgi:Ca2+-binding RTX toxin-like protein